MVPMHNNGTRFNDNGFETLCGTNWSLAKNRDFLRASLVPFKGQKNRGALKKSRFFARDQLESLKWYQHFMYEKITQPMKNNNIGFILGMNIWRYTSLWHFWMNFQRLLQWEDAAGPPEQETGLLPPFLKNPWGVHGCLATVKTVPSAKSRGVLLSTRNTVLGVER